jgi:uncharacterized membrane protein SpoIIM required for sporulation
MAELQLKSQRFRQERERDWRRLERLLNRLETESPARLSDEDLLAIPVLYRAALSSLSVARATSLDRSLIEYLESLSTRAYFVVYGARATLWARMTGFFATDWPRAARALWRETVVAALLGVAGTVTSFVLTSVDPDWYFAFIPGEMAGGRDPTASTEALRHTLYDPQRGHALSAFATALFTHNAQIAILAFALGFAFCLPTGMLAVANGLMLGAIFALFSSHGLGFELGGWLMIHGVTELLAVTLACAAGFRIGWRLAFPGERARMDAAAAAGREAAVLMIGVVLMLLVAGVLEGVGRQVVRADLPRYAIAVTSAVVWGVYLYAPRSRLWAHGR